ncbi:hypothetical protein PMIN01_05111 [Paraphaeosphaeria minitans]|uniref:Uncharacterized protein n=1 Tax=Paraphaeosphaeria minitans TaxID=565426 RepID=A0A9P6KSJ6_9PLEO|nr:hypothetical protein PMIN01_05111 [Paraphaeosphaeria minitans]
MYGVSPLTFFVAGLLTVNIPIEQGIRRLGKRAVMLSTRTLMMC